MKVRLNGPEKQMKTNDLQVRYLYSILMKRKKMVGIFGFSGGITMNKQQLKSAVGALNQLFFSENSNQELGLQTLELYMDLGFKKDADLLAALLEEEGAYALVSHIKVLDVAFAKEIEIALRDSRYTDAELMASDIEFKRFMNSVKEKSTYEVTISGIPVRFKDKSHAGIFRQFWSYFLYLDIDKTIKTIERVGIRTSDSQYFESSNGAKKKNIFVKDGCWIYAHLTPKAMQKVYGKFLSGWEGEGTETEL